MRSSISRLFPLALLFSLATTTLSGQEIHQAMMDEWNRHAIAWVKLLEGGKFQEASKRIDPKVPPNTFTPDKLEEIWKQVLAQAGKLRSVSPGVVTQTQGYQVVNLKGKFEKGDLIVRVVFTGGHKVSGLFFVPAEPAAYEPPAYVDRNAFTEKEVTIGESPWQLPGTVTIPNSAAGKPVAALVLVHGSGPQDRDERIGGNRIFRDLAWGLASRGIAVLRYDKRTYVHGAKMTGEITLEAEVIDDALKAVKVLGGTARVDPKRIFVLGHSQGGTLLPTILSKSANAAGGIVMAGSTRPPITVLVSQLTYLATLNPNAETKAWTDSVVTLLRKIEDGALPDSRMILGAPVSYYKRLMQLTPVKTARTLSAPLLVLQGGRDYQVTYEDMALWEKGLHDRKDVTFHRYPKLNHLFIAGEGKATPAEYTSKTGHIDARVIEDIARWILAAR